MMRRAVSTGLLFCVVTLTGCAWLSSDPTPESERAEALRQPPDLRALEADQPDAAPMAPVTTAASLARVDGELVLRVEASFFRTWSLIGDALADARFTVEDRDRTRGTYFIRYAVRDGAEGSSRGFFSRFAFWRDDEPEEPVRPYLVRLFSDGGVTRVAVYEDDGDPASDTIAEPVLETLREHL